MADGDDERGPIAAQDACQRPDASSRNDIMGLLDHEADAEETRAKMAGRLTWHASNSAQHRNPLPAWFVLLVAFDFELNPEERFYTQGSRIVFARGTMKRIATGMYA